VNLASRLEAHTKVAQRAILIDGTTQAELRNGVVLESLGAIDIRGKTLPVDVFVVATQPHD
jgi:class 3 adenylate cyclase